MLEIAEEQSKMNYIYQINYWKKIKEDQEKWLSNIEVREKDKSPNYSFLQSILKTPTSSRALCSLNKFQYKPLPLKTLVKEKATTGIIVEEMMDYPLLNIDLNVTPPGSPVYETQYPGWKRRREEGDDIDDHCYKKKKSGSENTVEGSTAKEFSDDVDRYLKFIEIENKIKDRQLNLDRSKQSDRKPLPLELCLSNDNISPPPKKNPILQVPLFPFVLLISVQQNILKIRKIYRLRK